MRATLTASILILLAAGYAAAKSRPIPVKVVVVTMFERGADSGDEPGELQYWVERNKLDIVLPFPQGYHNLRMNRQGVLAVLTGIGNTRAAAAIMALGLDPRFDLKNTYWLVAGIAGVDPADASLGSAAWAEWVVDGDIAYEIDAREIPTGWKTGYVPLRKSVPYEQPRRTTDMGEQFHLNATLVDWAFNLTRNVALVDTDAMREERRHFESPNAQRPPFVLKGDQLSSSTFWHGKLMSHWANEWVKYQTDGLGNYVTCAMEDTGTLQSLTFLAKAGRVDINRVLVLRTASDYDQQKPGGSAADSLLQNSNAKYTAFLPAVEAAWRVGNTVVSKILENWNVYRDHIPIGKP